MEKDFIKPIIREIKRRGLGVIDMQPLGGGVPDYFIFGACNRFLEFKNEENTLTPHQWAWIEENKKLLSGLNPLYFLVTKKGSKYYASILINGSFINEQSYKTIKSLVDRLL